MSLNKASVWADLRYAFEELDMPWHYTHANLIDAAKLAEQSGEEFFKKLIWSGQFPSIYSRAKSRADTRNAHEAIEKGLKAILIDGGLPEAQVRSRRHKLDQLLLDVQQHNPKVFKDLERCFDSTIQYLERTTGIQRNINIVSYFGKHGKAEVFVTKRYASIEGNEDKYEGMIGFVYREVLRSLMSLIVGEHPKDINSRIEEEVSKTILAESKFDPAWDAKEWLRRGPVTPRLEDMEIVKNNKVLRLAIRKCARESKDSGTQYWASMLRHKVIAAEREAKSNRRS